MDRDHHTSELIREWLDRPVPATDCANVWQLPAAVATTVGSLRSENQDRAVIARMSCPHALPSVLCIICDGMSYFSSGGMAAAEAATAMLISVSRHCSFPAINRIRSGIEAANAEILKKRPLRCGSTIAALLISGAGAAAATVGDTRVYKFSKRTRLHQISVDDTAAQELSRLDDPGKSRLNLDRFSRRLTRFLGMQPNVQGRYYQLGSAPPGTSYILCTDGAHRLGEKVLAGVFARPVHTSAALNGLIRFSRMAPEGDDASIISIDGNLRRALSRHGTPALSRLDLWDSSGCIEICANGLCQPVAPI
jgi:serine/threonine protein phosphatase PrpC